MQVQAVRSGAAMAHPGGMPLARGRTARWPALRCKSAIPDGHKRVYARGGSMLFRHIEFRRFAGQDSEGTAKQDQGEIE